MRCPRPLPRWRALLGVLAFACLIGSLGSGWLTPDGDRRAESTSTSPAAAGQPQSSEERTDTLASGLHQLGPLLVAKAAALHVENRAALAVATLPLGGDLNLRAAGGECRYGCTVKVKGIVALDGRPLRLSLAIAQAGLEVERVDETTVRLPPGAMVAVDAHDTEGRPHRVTLDRRGQLFVDPRPVPAEAVIAYSTGEGLDLSGMRRIGALPPRAPEDGSFAITVGAAEDCCSVSVQTARGVALLAPAAGWLRCLGPGRVELVTSEARLRFENVQVTLPMGAEGLAPCGSEGPVEAGERIGAPGHYAVTAWTDAGEPLALAAAGDGALHVGRAVVGSGCPPCRGS